MPRPDSTSAAPTATAPASGAAAPLRVVVPASSAQASSAQAPGQAGAPIPPLGQAPAAPPSQGAAVPQRFPVLDAIRAGQPCTPTVHESVLAETPAIHIDNLSLWYGKARTLHGVTMPVAAGKVTALIGPSGCGKSTLLRCINRMNDLIDGVRVQGSLRIGAAGSGGPGGVYSPGADVIALRRRVGMVFQKPNPFPMSIFDNVAYPLRIHGERRRETIAAAVETALRGAALWDEAKDRLKQSALGLSGGQQQRLCIARAIVGKPEILLMDEPCSALDPIATLRIEELIHQMSGRFTVLIVTHNMQQAARVSHFTAFMYLGRLVEFGRTADIFQNPRLAETEQYVTGRFG